jgi:hypothetical protein
LGAVTASRHKTPPSPVPLIRFHLYPDNLEGFDAALGWRPAHDLGHVDSPRSRRQRSLLQRLAITPVETGSESVSATIGRRQQAQHAGRESGLDHFADRLVNDRERPRGGLDREIRVRGREQPPAFFESQLPGHAGDLAPADDPVVDEIEVARLQARPDQMTTPAPPLGATTMPALARA